MSTSSSPVASRPVHVLLNPIAGGHRAPVTWQSIAAAASQSCPGLQLHRTEGPGHATELAQAAARAGASRVVVVGGDGTIQEAVAGLLHTTVSLGVIPAGTGNDFSRTHHIPHDPARALAIALGPLTRRMDVGTVNGRPYVNVAGVGFDAEVAAWTKYRTRWLRGPALYVAGVLTKLLLYSPQQLEFEIDGLVSRERCLLIAVGNGRYYGGGMKMCPDANPDDGLLDVVVGGDVGKVETLGLLTKIFGGRHIGHPKVRQTQASKVRVDGPRHLSVHADGEPVSNLPAEFGLIRSALAIAVPPAEC